jgi:hypothetical protein
MERGRGACWIALFLLAGAPAQAHAEPEGASACPSLEAIERVWFGMTGRALPANTDALPFSVVDEGSSFRVLLGGANRTFAEPRRRCDERARAAAVFIALALQQSEATPSSAAKEVASAESPSLAVSAVAKPQAARRFRLGAEIVGQVGGAAGHDGTIGGGSVRLSGDYRRKSFVVGLAIGAGAASPLRLDFDRGAALIQRTPMTLDVRIGARRGRFEADAAVGLAVTVLRVSGADLPTTQTSERAEAGLHFEALARWWFAQRVAPQLDFEAVVVPTPYAVAVAPSGNVVGHLPTSWLGASLGVAVRIR